MKVDIVDNIKYLDLKGRRELKNQIILILKSLNLPKHTEICISFVDDDAMRNLNKTYRGIKRTTDVLSFPQHEGVFQDMNAAIAQPFNTKTLGDIVISINTAKRNSKRYKNNLKEEVQQLTIHGILHLLGYDHKRKRDTEKMRRKEKDLKEIIQASQIVE